MKAVQLVEPKKFQFIDIPEPDSPAFGDTVVRVHCVGICGTDYGGYLGKMPFFSYPRIPGHELGVEVVAVGEGVENVKPGDRCSVEPYINCQKCYSCTRGHTNCCEHHQTLGVHCDGGLRRLFTVPARKLHLAPNLTHAQSALVETLAIGCHAVDRGNPQPTETVLVIGAGPIGLSVIEFSKISGAKTIVMDMNESRLEFVRESMNVPDTVVFRGDGSELPQIDSLTDGKLCDVVVDATGNCHSMSAAIQYCAFSGRMVYVGISQDEVKFPHAPIVHRRELTLFASRNALSKDFTRIIGLIEDGSIDTRPWITHQASLDDMLDEFPRWLDPDARVVKAVVQIEN